MYRLLLKNCFKACLGLSLGIACKIYIKNKIVDYENTNHITSNSIFSSFLFSTCRFKLLQTVDDDSTCFPLDLLERFHNLETLIRRRCSCEKVFSNGGYLKKHVRKFTMIKHLDLHKFNHLKQLWKQDSKLDSFVQSVSFGNLKELLVLRCKEFDELSNLLHSKKPRATVVL